MKVKIIILLLFLLIAADNSEAATQAFTGWLKNGESATTEKQSILVQINSAANKIWADYGSGALQVLNNSCDQTETLKVCVDNIEWIISERRYRAYLRVFTLAPKLTMTRGFANTNLIIGNDTIVTVTIENSGDVAADKVTYTDPLSDDIKIEDISGAWEEDGKAVWRGTIKAGETKEISYRIRPKEAMERKFAATLSYFDGFDTKTSSSSQVSLKVTPFVLMAARITGRSDIYIGEIFNYTVNITNLDTREVNFDFFELKLDRGLEITELPYEIKKTGEGIYRYENWKLIQNKSKAFRLKVKGKLTGESNLYSNARYTGFDKKERSVEEIKASVKASDKGVSIKSNLNEKTIEENEVKKLSILISNNNPAASIKNVFVSTSSGLVYLPDAYFPEIKQSSSERVEKTFKVPKVKQQQGYKINVNVTYTTEFGEAGSKLITDTVSAIPVKDLAITQTLDKTEIENGEVALVKVKIENPRLVKISNVAVRSAIPEEFGVSGSTSNTVNIYSKETVDALAYFITGPKVKTATKYNITTTADYSDEEKSYSYNRTSGITVKPRAMKLELAKSVSEQDIYEGEPFYVTYALKNPSSTDTARNIMVKFPLQQEFDLVNSKTGYNLESLGPGEIFYINSKEFVRAKYNTSLSLGKTTANYENEDGANFSVNSSEISLRIKTGYKKGPYIIIEKKAPDRGNNLEVLSVNITAKNIGNEAANVEIDDYPNKWSALLDAGAEKTFEYSTRITAPGTKELGQATAKYSYGNRSYATGSNTETIEIESKPLLALERTLPEKGNNIDNIKVELKAKNILGKELRNITIKDMGNEWNFDEIKEEQPISYITNFTSPGNYELEEATASYVYDGSLFNANSGKNTIAIGEKKAATLEKNATKEAKKGEEFTVTITATNNAESEIKNAIIKDSGKEWKEDIAAGEAKTVTYKMQLNESAVLEPASINFEYGGRDFEEISNTIGIEVKEEKINQTALQKEEKPKGIIGNILNFIKGIVTWKRK